jgi:hypothetical protein
VSWYLRSIGDRDTHRGEWSPVTRSVIAVCGVEFVPLPLPFDRIALSGSPPDPAQICPQCYRAKATR